MKRVMIVDDDPDAHVNLKFFLEQSGVKVTRVFDGLDALRRFKKEKPQVVITDTHLTGMMGPELRQRVLSFAPKTTVVACSSKAKSKELYPKGVLFFDKPYMLDELPELLQLLRT